MPSLSYSVHTILRSLGWELTRFNAQKSEWAALRQMLATHNVDTIIDVGANTGQFAQAVRSCGFSGRIISFEPSLDAHRQLVQTAKGDSNWTIADRVAVGSAPGTATLHISKNGASSSLLPILPAHTDSAPASAYVAEEEVPVMTLDQLAGRYLPPNATVFLKIDVQGYEADVLDGAKELLQSRVVGLQVELSLVPLYGGQALFDTLYERLKKLGFEMWYIAPVFTNTTTGRMLQLDGLFFRRSSGMPA